MIRNVIIVNDFDYVQGGASKVALDTANLLKRKYSNLNIYFFSGVTNNDSYLDEGIIKVCTYQGENLKDKNILRGCINGVYNFRAKKKLNQLLKQLNSDNTIIHIHGWTKCLSSSIFSAIYKKNFKFVITLHDYFTACPNGGYYNYKQNTICRLSPLSFQCIKCNCDSRSYYFKIYRIIRQFIQSNIVKLNKKLKYVITISRLSEDILRLTLNSDIKISRIYNPIDINYDVADVNYEDNKYYLYVGRISKEKGVDLFCEAITNLKYIGIVVGDGEQREDLSKRYPNIKFVGWKNKIEVEKYLQNSKALIFTSNWYETMGLTVLEAQRVGIPVFVRDGTAAVEFTNYPDLIYNNKKDLVNKIINFERNGTKKKNVINFEDFSSDNYINKLMKCYDSILMKVNREENK